MFQDRTEATLFGPGAVPVPVPVLSLVINQCHGHNRKQTFLGANTLENESSTERKFLGHFALGRESSRKRIGEDPIGEFAPGRKLARERKG